MMTTTIRTPFAEKIYSTAFSTFIVWDDAQSQADANGAPVGVWERDGWTTICEDAPETIEPNPEDRGWHMIAVVEPGTDNI